MSSVVIIGIGGVGSVAAKKCAGLPDVFSKICLASRRIESCEEVKSCLRHPNITTAQVDASNTRELVALFQAQQPQLVIHTGMPYHNLTIMDACLETGTHYIDSASYEHPDKPTFFYGTQWDYFDKFREKGLTAILGSGFDPGVTGVFCAYAKKHHFDTMDYIDIMDANGGDHGKPFATNFNPEINIREVTQNGMYYDQFPSSKRFAKFAEGGPYQGAGKWVETEPFEMKEVFDFPQIGKRSMYLIYHEELESLVKNYPEIQRIRFWMTFSDQYLKFLSVLQDVGMTSIVPINYEGHRIVPLQFLKAVLPAPSSLGESTVGKTCIGCMIEGQKNGQKKKLYIYNVCNHQDCFKELGAQAVSYTTGVPMMIGAKLLLEGQWKQAGVYNVEEFDPDPYMEDLNRYGLPWVEEYI